MLMLTAVLTLGAGTVPADAVAQTAADTARPAQGSGKSAGKPENSGKDRSTLESTIARKKVTARQKSLTPQREKLALSFSRKHHPELADLLKGLRSRNRAHYEDGVRELARDAERFARLEQRGDERFSSSLKIWKLDSRIRLEAARFSLRPSLEVENKLRQLMLDRQSVRLEYLKLERQRAQTRVDRLNDQIRSASEAPDRLVSAELTRLRKLLAAKNRNQLNSPSPRRNKTPDATAPGQNASGTKPKSPRKPAQTSSQKPD